jgi:uncharacterized membrane protein YjjB (DUF3815 family)
MCGIWYFVPGYGVTLATSELVEGKKIMSGVSRFMKATVTLLWLLTGSWLADRCWMHTGLVSSLADPSNDSNSSQTDVPSALSPLWLLLFFPVLLLSISIVLNNAARDVPWAVLCMAVALLTTWGGTTLLGDDMVGILLGSTLMTVYANVWSNTMRRPNTLVLVPAYLLQASGSIGYLGLMHLVDGDRTIGTANVLQMFLVALLITAGVCAGNTLVSSYQLM